jgi:actin-related protein 8
MLTSLVEDGDLEDEDTVDPSEPADSQPKKPEETIELSLIGIDQAILQSIERCETDDMKKRMYSCIMVVGGGLMFQGLRGWLQHLIWSQMSPTIKPSIESQEIITKTKVLLSSTHMYPPQFKYHNLTI